MSNIETSSGDIVSAILDNIVRVVFRKLNVSSNKELLWDSDFIALNRVKAFSHYSYFVPLEGIYKDDDKYYLVSRPETSTLQVTSKINSLPDQISISLGLARGMKILRENHIAHGDLIPSNIFLFKENNSTTAKIGGFRNCIHFKKEGQVSDKPHFLSVNSPPEFFNKEKTNWTPNDYFYADIFSFGCVLYEMISGKHPFKELFDTSDELKYEQIQNQYNQLLSRITSLPNSLTESSASKFKFIQLDTTKNFCNLIQNCLVFEPKKRISWEEIIKELESMENSDSKSSNTLESPSPTIRYDQEGYAM